MITILLTLFILFFIGYSIFLYFGIKNKEPLVRIRGKIMLGAVVLFLIFSAILSFIYLDLSNKGYGFKVKYRASIDPVTKTVLVGTNKDCDIRLFNPFSDNEHIVFDFNKKEPTVSIISKRRSAIVNNKLLTLKKKNTTVETTIKNGDILRLGYSDYLVNFNSNSVELKNLFFAPSVINIFNLYSTTTLPNLTNENYDISVWVIFAITILTVVIAIWLLITFMHKLAYKFAYIGEKGYILYPILYFTFFLIFLILVSMINFTLLQFHQFSVYNKGALYTVLLVYWMMFFTMFIAYLTYNKKWYIALLLMALAISLVIYNSNYIYTSSHNGIWGYVNKSMVMTLLDWSYIFIIFGFFIGLWIKKVINNKEGLIYQGSFNILAYRNLLFVTLAFTLLGVIVSMLLHEGAGIVVIESVKLFIFFFFTIVLLDEFERGEFTFSILFFLIILFSILFSSIALGLKDNGSLIQVVVAMSMIFLFFYSHFKNIGLINKKSIVFIWILIAIATVLAIYYISHSDNIRIKMWLSPFAQDLEVKNQFFIYYFEQIARALYLMHSGGILPLDAINKGLTPLPNLHTDFIFAFYVTVFGFLGFIAMVVAFVITIFSFEESVERFQKAKSDIYRFIYGVNVIFIVYIFSYIIVNILSVLQVIPLTDVPFPILTYARGVLILFFVLYAVILALNYLYLKSVSKETTRRVK